MALKYGNTAVQNYIFNCGGNHIVSNYKINNNLVWSSGGVTDSSYFTFTLLDDDTYSIAAKDITTLPATVVLPDTYEGKAVTRVADAGFVDFGNEAYNQTMITLYIPQSIISIGNDAFSFCINLKRVVIERGVTSIGERAFIYCQSLIDINIPDSVTSIGVGAFADTAYYNNTNKWKNDVLYIGNHLIKAKKVSGEYVIKDGTITIASSAFLGGYSSTRSKIIIPNSVTNISSGAFDGSNSLDIYCEATSQPEGWLDGWYKNVLTIVWGYTCHRGHLETDWIIDKEATPTSTGSRHKECTKCGAITTETIPKITTSEDYFTFTELADGTYSVKAKSTSNLPDYVVIPNTYNGKSVTQIADLAFSGAMMSKLYIHEGITSIGYASFNGCTNLVEANLPASVTSIGDQAFNGCSSLATFTIADNSQLTYIGEYAFNYCSALTSIVIPASVTTIGAYAFRNCSNLTINCEASSKPSGWDTAWVVISANSGCSVNWGYTS